MAAQHRPDDSAWPGSVGLDGDAWTLQAQWGPRRDDLTSCTDRLLRCLTGLAALDENLARWYHDADEVTVDAPNLRRLLERNWDREDPAGEIGTTVALWNGVKDDDRAVATITVSCGSTASYLRNSVIVELPRPAAAPRLYDVGAMQQLFATMITAWRPRWGRVWPLSLDEAIGGESIGVVASWMLYLDREVYRRSGALPEEVSTIEHEGAGELFVLAPTPRELRLSTVHRLRERIAIQEPL